MESEQEVASEAKMSDVEIFSKARMDRCATIHRTIMENWRATDSFAYVVRATDSVSGISLNELRTRYFAVGVGEFVWEVPFHDMLVVFSMIEQECKELKKWHERSASDRPENFTIRYEISTSFPDNEVVRLLRGVRVETPFDAHKFLRIQAE
ncbi:MAG: hypothetical protein ABUL64_02790 [Singulisphaera sp.]